MRPLRNRPRPTLARATLSPAAIGVVGLLALGFGGPTLAQDDPARVGSHAGTRRSAFRPIVQGRTSEARQRTGRAQADGATGFTVAVFGDALGFDVARGLTDLYERNADTHIVDATAGDASILHGNAAAWAGSIDAVAARTGTVQMAVIMAGANDLTPVVDAQGRVQGVGSAEWRRIFGERADQLAALFHDRQIPLIWVGLPVVRDADRASSFASLNALFRDRAGKNGATFVDTWDGFLDDEGDYSPTGPDVEGRESKLRRNDGTGFTRDGARKLASFVDVDLKQAHERLDRSKRLDTMSVADPTVFDQALQIDVNAQIRREAGLPVDAAPSASTDRERERPILVLTAPPVARDGRLATLGDRDTPIGGAAGALARGVTPDAKAGRIDDFTWPRP